MGKKKVVKKGAVKTVKKTSKKRVKKPVKTIVKKTVKKPLKAVTKKKVEGPEFLYLPLGSILVEEQIRSTIDTEGDSFKALMESIKDKGILEPVIVTPKDDSYLLICGERRCLAAQNLGLETIPARVVDTITGKDEILAFQLTENLQREDLNPIDQAKGILAYIQAKLPDKKYDVDKLMGDLVMYNRRPEDLPEEIAVTVTAIIEISGKSIKTLFNRQSLLKLPDTILAAVSAETLPVSQGYIFAANLDCPDRDKIFEFITKIPVTNATLTNMLTAWKKPKPDPGTVKFISATKQVAAMQSWEAAIKENLSKYKKADLQKILDQSQEFTLFVKRKMLPPV